MGHQSNETDRKATLTIKSASNSKTKFIQKAITLSQSRNLKKINDSDNETSSNSTSTTTSSEETTASSSEEMSGSETSASSNVSESDSTAGSESSDSSNSSPVISGGSDSVAIESPQIQKQIKEPLLVKEKLLLPEANKRRGKRRKLTVCLKHCRYDLVRDICKRYGIIEVPESALWSVYWTDYTVSLERALSMKNFQIINHFPGMTEICRKDLLARNLNRMKRVFPEDYNIFPTTWCLPTDNNELQAYSSLRQRRTYICKPAMGCQGRGIFLVKNIKDLNPFGRIICQVYIQKPFLIDGLKFDLRIYVLITSCDPLRVWVHKEGLARFATAKYHIPSQFNTENSYMHLTNYSVNKYSRDFVIDGDKGTKRKLSSVYKWMNDKGCEVAELKEKIDDVIIKTILSAHPIIKHHYKTCFPHHDLFSACFEILGFDILVDHKLKPYLIEVNHSPSFHTDTNLDADIKQALLNDTFNMLNVSKLDRVRIERDNRKKVQERLSSKISEVKSAFDPSKVISKKQSKPGGDADCTLEERSRLKREEYVRSEFDWELNHSGGYRLIYPRSDSEKYDKFLSQNMGSIFQETTASQARAIMTKAHMDEYNLKKQLEEQKRSIGLFGKESVSARERLRPETGGFTSSTELHKKRVAKFITHSILPINHMHPKNCFTMNHIVAKEDCERVRGLVQRGILIRSLGIELQAYQLLCKVGTLRKLDHELFRRKHGFALINYLPAAQRLGTGMNKEQAYTSTQTLTGSSLSKF